MNQVQIAFDLKNFLMNGQFRWISVELNFQKIYQALWTITSRCSKRNNNKYIDNKILSPQMSFYEWAPLTDGKHNFKRVWSCVDRPKIS